jgi:hypothetical protein
MQESLQKQKVLASIAKNDSKLESAKKIKKSAAS